MALLAIDVGNTQTVLGLFDGEELREHWRVATEHERTGDELGLLLRGLVDLAAVEGIAMSCTVPPLVRAYEGLAELAPELEIPGWGTVRETLAGLQSDS